MYQPHDRFPDVHKSSKPLVTGTRLQLTYHVYPKGPKCLETATSIANQAQDFEDGLNKWKRPHEIHKTTDPPRLLAYVLLDDEDYYSDMSLSFSSLTAVDKLRAKWLLERCERQGMIPLLSRLLGNVVQGTGYYNPSETTLELENFVDFDGNSILNATSDLEPEDLVQKDIYRGRYSNDPETEFGSDTEEGSYVNWAFVLIPKEDMTAFLYFNRSDDEIRSWIQRLTDEVRAKLPSDNTRLDLVYLVSQYTNRLERYLSFKSVSSSPDCFRLGFTITVRASILLKDKDLFATNISQCPASVSQDLCQEIGEAVNNHTIAIFKTG
ncbi:MAG: hypothetical protein Q9226_003323 [Calogaya cf. arnoldii]